MQHLSLWLDTCDLATYPALDGTETCEVCVVGAGIVGPCSALILARAGMDVIVVEADRVGAGVTGHSSAKVSAQHGLIYAKLIDDVGLDRARMYADANRAGMSFIRSIAARGTCDLLSKPAFVWAENQREQEQCLREAHAARQLGFDAAFVEQVDVPIEHVGALRFADQLQFDPRKFLALLTSSKGLSPSGDR